MADGEEIDLEKLVFMPNEIQPIVSEAIESTLKSASYNTQKVDQWTSGIIESCLKRLSAMNIPFKYIVTCVVMQRVGAGVHSSCAALWDNSTDNVCSVTWNNDTIQCVASVYGLSI